MSDHNTAPTTPDTVRVEVIANRSVQEDFFERLKDANIGTHYTLYPVVQGAGDNGPRRGDHIWPEENFVYVTYVNITEARTIRTITDDLTRIFPTEGIRFFAAQGLHV